MQWTCKPSLPKNPSDPVLNQYKKISSSYIFSCGLCKLFKIVTDQVYSQNFLTGSKYTYSNFRSVYWEELQSYQDWKEIQFLHKSSNSVIAYTIKDIFESDYYCCINFLGEFRGLNIPTFMCDFFFHWESPNKTWFISCYYVPKSYSEEISFENQRKNYYKHIDNFISNRDHLRVHVDSITINGCLSSANCIMSNLKIAFGTFSTVITVSDILEEGAKITSVVNCNDILGYDIKLISLATNIDVTKDYISILLWVIDKDERLGERIVEVKCNKLKQKNKLLFTIRHHYKQELNDKQYKYVSFYKKKCLHKLAKLIQCVEYTLKSNE